MISLVSRTFLGIVVLFILPGLLHLGYWVFQDRPSSWRTASWSSAGILPAPQKDQASIYILAARTGGMKGALASHSWIVLKKPGLANYDRYDVVGWGRPVRKNAYDPDGRWYSNAPMIHYQLHGEPAAKLIGKIEDAITKYRWRNYGDYKIWPGPNSNTFVASIVQAVHGFDPVMPSTAVGRDYPVDGNWFTRSPSGTIRATLAGYAGFVLGGDEGFELNFLGLVAGFNWRRGEIKIPAIGSVYL